ncbi:hypothetical protein GCM10009760_47640 [Kitasatospora kazusensis]|uniref:DUF488 family protein n=1 Tax=Kitasatospora kazusensis TaxID=407974 RepID=A0ABN3A150_9ACTN
MPVRYRRIHAEPGPAEGVRVLVDRLWPRGLRKEDAGFDEWLREVAPSTELRRWYGHQPERYAEFRRRYLAELAAGPAAEALGRLRTLAAAGPLTLLTATHDAALSHAAVLAELLARPAGQAAGRPPAGAGEPTCATAGLRRGGRVVLDLRVRRELPDRLDALQAQLLRLVGVAGDDDRAVARLQPEPVHARLVGVELELPCHGLSPLGCGQPPPDAP